MSIYDIFGIYKYKWQFDEIVLRALKMGIINDS